MRRGSVVRHARGETIYSQGSPGDSLIILLSGSLKITNVTTDAREVVLGFAKPGALIGEIAVLDGSPRSADVVALEATEAFVIYRRDLMPILRVRSGCNLRACGRAVLHDPCHQRAGREPGHADPGALRRLPCQSCRNSMAGRRTRIAS